MATHYSDPTREADTYSLPDVETFYISATGTPWEDEDGNRLASGWYFWFCFPGCMPEGDPSGPYATEQAAIDAMREQVSD